MGKRKRRREDGAGSFLETYRRIRKPMPPPEQIQADRRRMLEDDARREIEEASRRDDSTES